MKKKISTIILAIVIAGSIKAQNLVNFNMFSSSLNNIIAESVSNGLNIVKQEYVLIDTVANNPTRYGHEDKDYFGCDYAFGVVVDGRMLTYKYLLTPWNIDSNYNQYKNNAAYRPILSERFYRPIKISQYSEIKDDVLYNETNDSICVVAGSLIGFSSDLSYGEKDGWVVTLSAPKASVDTLVNFKVNAYKNKITTSADSLSYEVKPINLENHLWGGFYVIPNYNKIGTIELKVAGVLQKVNNKWSIIPIKNALEQSKRVTLSQIEPSAKEEEEEENERKKSKKRKKNRD